MLRTRYPSGKLETTPAFEARLYATVNCYRHARAGTAHSKRSGASRRSKGLAYTQTPLKPAQPFSASTATGLGPLQPFAFNSPNPKRHDLIAERERGATCPEPSDGEIMALLKVCLELHEPLLECWEEAAQAALPTRRVPRAKTSRARWQA